MAKEPNMTPEQIKMRDEIMALYAISEAQSGD